MEPTPTLEPWSQDPVRHPAGVVAIYFDWSYVWAEQIVTALEID